MRAVILAALGAALWAGAPSAAVETPGYELGQTFVFANGRVEQVAGVDGDRVTWATRSGRTYQRDVNPVVPVLEWRFRGRDGRRTVHGDPDRLWPLRRGASARFRVVNDITDTETGRERRSAHYWTCRVRAMETVEVPAGLFDAYPIECDRYSPNTMRVLQRVTWDFAPSVGHYVRRTTRNLHRGGVESFDLYAALAPRRANPLRVEALVAEARAD